jgi:hypothetical protein
MMTLSALARENETVHAFIAYDKIVISNVQNAERHFYTITSAAR